MGYRETEQNRAQRSTHVVSPQRHGGPLRALVRHWWAFFDGRCLTGFPWFWPSQHTHEHVMVDARRIVRQKFGYGHRPLYRALAQVLTAVAWPPAIIVHLVRIRRERGRIAVPMTRVPGALWAALRHNILPGEYYAYGLWRLDQRAKVDLYLYGNEGARLFKILNRPSPEDPIGDKLAFHEMCKSHWIPSPRILAAFTPAGKLTAFESSAPPEHDLFVKPRIGLGSGGTERLQWQDAVFENHRGHRIRPEDLAAYLAARAREEDRTLIVQPALANHPGMPGGANGKLTTLRLVTGIFPNRDVIPIFGFLYVARASQIGTAPSRAVLIDVASGRLMPAREELSEPRTYESTNDAMCTLPDWDLTLQYVEVAHRACSNFIFVGWDVVFTKNGPMFLEGNANWCADDYQRLQGEPLGVTKFASVLAQHLRP
jgi:hypothetical protein